MTLQDFAYLGNPITEESNSGDLERTVIDRNGATVATLKAESYNGMARLDYAAVLRSIQENEGVGSLASGCLRTQKEYALQVLANINSVDYIFVRGVAQRTNIAATAFKFLTNMPELRHYDGYPLTVSYLINNTSATSWSVKLDGEQYENSTALANMAQVLKAHATSVLTTAPQGVSHVDSIVIGWGSERRTFVYYDNGGLSARPYRWRGIDSDTADVFMVSASRDPQVDDTVYKSTNDWPYHVFEVSSSPHTHGTLSLYVTNIPRDTIQVREMPVPAHPFYVRWVNTKGGWDYFMFACNQKQTNTLTKNDTYEPYVLYYGRYGVRSSYNKAATTVVEVSTGTINRATLESVLECVYSPLVQLYDEANSEWVEIQPKTDKQEIMADQPTGEVMMSFELPTPQLNK